MEWRIFPCAHGDTEGSGGAEPEKMSPLQPGANPSRMTAHRLVFLSWLLALSLAAPLAARQQEQGARLAFQKTAGRNAGSVHIVKRGETLHSIIRKFYRGKPVSLARIKRLNPKLKNINRIRPGQRLLLPAQIPVDQAPADLPSAKESEDKPVAYRIRENDSISRIILSGLKTKFSSPGAATDARLNQAETITTYRRIIKLNPGIPDMNNLPVGQTMLLPAEMVKDSGDGLKKPEQETLPARAPVEKEAAAKTNPVLNSLLTAIRPVITRMGGTLNTSGSYFIPLQETARIIIDCALIPSVELDDGTTVFLDYQNRFNDKFKQMIAQYWRNYHFLSEKDLRDEMSALRKIISLTENYEISRSEKPLIIKTKPEVSVFPDWIVKGRKKTKGTEYRQGIFLLAPGEKPLPAAAREFLEQSGFAVTELSREKTSPDAVRKGKPVIRNEDLRGLTGVPFAERLLNVIGAKPLRGADIAIFRQAENGFNLSIKADLLLSTQGGKLIVQAKKLPDEFVQIIRKSGFEFITITGNDNGRKVVEAIVRGAGLPVSSVFFAYRIPPEGGKSRLQISFSALSSSNETGRIQLVDFDIPAPLADLIYRCPDNATDCSQQVLLIRY